MNGTPIHERSRNIDNRRSLGQLGGRFSLRYKKLSYSH
ncbi:hypothetical protein SD15574_0688, partial [Shigella dysenteriae 155-74]